jgi:hypothetical protein
LRTWAATRRPLRSAASIVPDRSPAGVLAGERHRAVHPFEQMPAAE